MVAGTIVDDNGDWDVDDFLLLTSCGLFGDNDDGLSVERDDDFFGRFSYALTRLFQNLRGVWWLFDGKTTKKQESVEMWLDLL